MTSTSASSRLALAIFYRAYLDAVNPRRGSAVEARRSGAIAWLREYGATYLVLVGVPVAVADEMVASVLAGRRPVPPCSNTGAQNEDGSLPF